MSDFSEYYANKKDALEYRLKIIFFTLAILACYFFYANEIINVFWMAFLTTIMVTRWLIAFHELFHLRSPDQLDFITRLQPIPFAPFNLGYREYREIHKGHHLNTATEKDPDAFHIRGGFVKAFLGSVTIHEQSVVRYISEHGLNRELVVMMLLRLSIFICLLLISPFAFLTWWLVLRVTYIINDFLFFHVVHYRGGQAGTFSLPLPVWLMYPFLLVYGFDVVYATMYHDTHHQHSLVAAKHLPCVTQLIKAEA